MMIGCTKCDFLIESASATTDLWWFAHMGNPFSKRDGYLSLFCTGEPVKIVDGEVISVVDQENYGGVRFTVGRRKIENA